MRTLPSFCVAAAFWGLSSAAHAENVRLLFEEVVKDPARYLKDERVRAKALERAQVHPEDEKPEMTLLKFEALKKLGMYPAFIQETRSRARAALEKWSVGDDTPIPKASYAWQESSAKAAARNAVDILLDSKEPDGVELQTAYLVTAVVSGDASEKHLEALNKLPADSIRVAEKQLMAAKPVNGFWFGGTSRIWWERGKEPLQPSTALQRIEKLLPNITAMARQECVALRKYPKEEGSRGVQRKVPPNSGLHVDSGACDALGAFGNGLWKG